MVPDKLFHAWRLVDLGGMGFLLEWSDKGFLKFRLR